MTYVRKKVVLSKERKDLDSYRRHIKMLGEENYNTLYNSLFKGYPIAERIYTGEFVTFPDNWFIFGKRYYTLKRVSKEVGLGYRELDRLFKDGTLPVPTLKAWVKNSPWEHDYKLIRFYSVTKIAIIKEILENLKSGDITHHGRRGQSRFSS